MSEVYSVSFALCLGRFNVTSTCDLPTTDLNAPDDDEPYDEDEDESEDRRVLLGVVDKDDDKPQTSFEAQRETVRCHRSGGYTRVI